MDNDFKFGTAINCIDGRTQQVVIDYMKQNHGVDGVDMVTFPGADGIFVEKQSEIIEQLKKSVAISVEKHGSRTVAVVGHHDCAGNPGDSNYHREHIRKAIIAVSAWKFPVQVVGLYVNDRWQIEAVK